MQNVPLVSVRCITYNHESYIRKCLEGFIMQKTNFKFEVIVHDDASTDKTADIIREYAEEYPDIIKPIYEKENQYSKGVEVLCKIMDKHMQGKYIAICEGDDYRIDENKLQKQVDFMEKHENYSLCFHAHKYLYNDNSEKEIHQYADNNYDVSVKDIILKGGGFIETSAMLFRKDSVKDKPFWYFGIPYVYDYQLNLLLSIRGKVCYLNDVMSTWRASHPGSFTSKQDDMSIVEAKKRYLQLTFYDDFDEYTNKKYHKYIQYMKYRDKLIFLYRVLRIGKIIKRYR